MIAEALARSGMAHGVEIETDAPVAAITVENVAATGVVLADGRQFTASLVVANTHPKILYERLLDPALLPETLKRDMAGYRSCSGTFRMNVALSELPAFSFQAGTQVQDYHRASIQIVPSLAYLERAYRDAVTHGWARQPVIEMAIPSTLDDTLAPPGQHVASLFCQHFAPLLPDGRDWAAVREEVADLILDTVSAYAPNFRRAVIARRILSPQDLEREFHLIGGDIFHGALQLDQLYVLRPAAGYADYRSPIANLYLCGSGTHPGGGVSEIPGRNAAREILKDRRSGILRR